MTSIYILDDDHSILSSLALFCEFLFRVEIKIYSHVEDLYAGIDQLATGVLLVDQQMPECTGVEVIRTLARCADRRLAMILMSGSVDASLVDEAKAAGAAAVIEKPCSTDMLRQLIQRSNPRIALRALPIAEPSPTACRMSGLSRNLRFDDEARCRQRDDGDHAGPVNKGPAPGFFPGIFQ